MDGKTCLSSQYQFGSWAIEFSTTQLCGQPQIFQQYQSIMDFQLANGIIEPVDPTLEINNNKHYVPHHAVFTPGKDTTKFRVVYDGSAKSNKNNLSTNECLHRGPAMLDDVHTLLIR